MNEKSLAVQIIESLRKGVPPQRGVERYSTGNEKLLDGIKREHLATVGDFGRIRFVSGSWGAGKTHFFRLLREAAFQNDCLISNVELNVNDAALNKFEKVFYAIIRKISTPSCYAQDLPAEAAPFGTVLQEALAYLGTGKRELPQGGEVPHEAHVAACGKLMADRVMDIDFKKIVLKYWETFLPAAADPGIVEQQRGEILQWFSGEGTVGTFRKRFGVSKMVTKENARVMLQSLAQFVRLCGYNGLVILFDEAEQAYSLMRKSALRTAHDNLRSLIDNVEALPGLFLIYATTPDFYSDPKHGIVIYGALAGRIGKPENRPPRARELIWNLDAVQPTTQEYVAAAGKIRDIYLTGFPQDAQRLPSSAKLDKFVQELCKIHPSLSAVRFWRVLVTGVIAHIDDHLEGEVRPAQELYDNVIDRLREE